ncbi:MAG: tetratricopeptide repeat protein, partial [bacterium]
PGVSPADPVRARPWLEKAAALGGGGGIYDLAAALLTGAGGPADEKRAIMLLEQDAAQGNVRAAWQLAWQSALGQGMPRDPIRAAKYIDQATFWGYDTPGLVLGSQPDQAEVFRRYFTRGLRALEKNAAAGDAFAGGLAARFYQQEDSGVKTDFARSVAFARPAAAAGSSEAMRVLGSAYHLGWGVEADQAKSADWFRRGAEAGNSYCMMWYSQDLFSGEGGKRDGAAAIAWLERSGERGNHWAIRDLGNFYDVGGRGLTRDLKKATYWKRKALGFNDEEARGWLISHHLLE